MGWATLEAELAERFQIAADCDSDLNSIRASTGFLLSEIS